MDNGQKIFCIIPAFNEEKNISEVISSVRGKVYEIIVVDDGSCDKTAEKARATGVLVLRHFINRGQGAALETGNIYALSHGADIIVHFDADNQFDAKEIGDLVSPILDKNYDVVIGSRFLGKKSEMPKIKEKIIFPLARLVNKYFFGINLSDPQSGFRAMTKDAAVILRITLDGPAHCTEILHKIFKYHLRVREVPISVSYHRFGQNLSGGIKIFQDLIISKIFD